MIQYSSTFFKEYYMYNRLACALSGQTIQASNDAKVTLIFNGVSVGSEVGKVSTPFPFIFNFDFISKLEPSTKEDCKDFRRFIYYLLNNYDLTIKNLSESETKEFSFSNIKKRPSQEALDYVSNAILSFPSDEYEIFFKSYGITFSIVPFVSTQKQFEVIKNNDFLINYNFKNKDALIAWQLKNRPRNKELRKLIENKNSAEIHNIAIQRMLKKNKSDLYKESFLEESLFLQIPVFEYVGMNGIRKKSVKSIEKMFDTYWTIYKLTEMNINLNQTSITYPNTRINDDLIKYHEKRLEVLKQELE